jgi:hypothetical protein
MELGQRRLAVKNRYDDGIGHLRSGS